MERICPPNFQICQEIYGDDKCPEGNNMVTMQSQCGNTRQGCVDCSKIVSDEPTKEYPDECYEEHEITILDVCKHKM